MLFVANEATPERGAPKSRAATEAVSRFGEAHNVDMNVHTQGNTGSTPVSDGGAARKCELTCQSLQVSS